ncbi:DUF4225 domain-containing protein [Pseudomonas sp. SDO528_S397]
MQFNHEVAYYARGIVREVEDGRKSAEQALLELKREQRSYLELSLAITRQGLGLLAGGIQFKTGVQVCMASFGTLCAPVGVPIMAHGGNNIYESGRNVWEGRTDTEGPLRKVYQQTALALGGEKETGDFAYSIVDASTSIYSLWRLMLKRDAWKLYRYIKADYIRAYKNSSAAGLAADGVFGVLSADDIRKRWESLSE